MTWRDDERELLEAAKALEPDAARSRMRLMARLSTASAVSLAAASVQAAVAVETSLALGAAQAAGLSALAKATVIGGAVGAAAGVASDRLNEPTSPPAASTPTEASALIAPSSPAPREEDERAMRDPDETTQADHDTGEGVDLRGYRLGESGSTPPTAAPPADASSPAEPEETRRARETHRQAIEALDAARAALATRNVRAAQRALEIYDAHRGDGRLDPEAALLRLQALQAAGHCRQAAALAERWLAQQPSTTYGPALRALITQCR